MDLRELYSISADKDVDKLTHFFAQLDSAFRGMIILPKPIACVAAGHSIAGGAILNLASDYFVLAAKSEQKNGGFMMGLTELQVGVPFPSLPFQIVERQLSSLSARRWTMSADLSSALESFSMGVGDVIVAKKDVHDLQESHRVIFTDKNTAEVAEDEALRWLKKVTSRPLDAFANLKAQWWRHVAYSYPDEKENPELFRNLTSDACLAAMKSSLK